MKIPTMIIMNCKKYWCFAKTQKNSLIEGNSKVNFLNQFKYIKDRKWYLFIGRNQQLQVPR